jgi:hypothetical protein
MGTCLGYQKVTLIIKRSVVHKIFQYIFANNYDINETIKSTHRRR